MFSFIWNTLIKAPINTALIFLYHALFQNLGLAIIALTVLIQLILTPLRLPSLRTSKKMQELKPHLDGLKEKHKDDRATLVQAQLELYKKHGVNPLGGILPTLVSIPVIIALYQVLLGTLQSGSGLSTTFLWLNLAKSDPYFILPALVGVTQYFSSKLLMPAVNTQPTLKSQEGKEEKKGESLEESMAAMQNQMKFIFPLFSAFIVASLPSGVGLYWFVSLVFSIIQQKLIK